MRAVSPRNSTRDQRTCEGFTLVVNRNCGEGCTARLSANSLVLGDARGTTKYPRYGVAQRKENNSRDDGSGLSIQGHSGVSEFLRR